MYQVSSQQNQYKTYTLSDPSANSHVQVVPERGGIVVSWKIGDREIFYLDTERFTHQDLSVRGGNPILFPLCGNLPNDTYSVEGKEYKIKQHGFARELPWRVISQSEQDGASLTIQLGSNAATKEVYPFDFEVNFTYKLRGDTLEIIQEYKNLSAIAMPFYAGFHPYFLCNNKDKIEVQIPSTKYEDNRTKNTIDFDGNFDFEQEEIDAVFTNLSAKSTSVSDRDRQLQITIDYDDFFTCLVFWTVKGKNFYCLEPWSAGRNAFNTRENLTVLAPHSSCNASVSIKAQFN